MTETEEVRQRLYELRDEIELSRSKVNGMLQAVNGLKGDVRSVVPRLEQAESDQARVEDDIEMILQGRLKTKGTGRLKGDGRKKPPRRLPDPAKPPKPPVFPAELAKGGSVTSKRHNARTIETVFVGRVPVRLTGKAADLFEILAQVKRGPDGKRLWTKSSTLVAMLGKVHPAEAFDVTRVYSIVHTLRNQLEAHGVDRRIVQTERRPGLVRLGV